jgi:hypothetical protein
MLTSKRMVEWRKRDLLGEFVEKYNIREKTASVASSKRPIYNRV